MVKTGSLIFEHCQLRVYMHIPYPYPAIPGSNKWEPPNSGYDSDQGWAGIWFLSSQSVLGFWKNKK